MRDYELWRESNPDCDYGDYMKHLERERAAEREARERSTAEWCDSGRFLRNAKRARKAAQRRADARARTARHLRIYEFGYTVQGVVIFLAFIFFLIRYFS